ncbi:hypothetical protein [Micromonospora profundi]|uniref:hypothetical protein n=1 Tax=Micromonospora profundi TaxID=1420889 RepID=UPI0036AF4411
MVVNLLDQQDEAGQALLRRLSPPSRASSQDPWVLVAERADALRQGAIAELLLNAEAGRLVLRRASREYNRLGLPFGHFLAVVATGEPMGPAAEAHLMRLLGMPTSGQAVSDAGQEAGLLSQQSVLARPEQQLYLLLAGATNAPRLGSDFRSAVGTAQQASQPATVGALGQPLSALWETGRLIAETAVGNEEVRPALRDHIADLGRTHGRQLRLAQVDEFHWRHALARADLIDLDLAGIVAQSVRALRHGQLPRWRPLDEFGELSPLAQVSITVGLRLGGGDDVAYEDSPWDPDPSPVVTGESAESNVD